MPARPTVMFASVASAGHFLPILALARAVAARGLGTVVAAPEPWRGAVESHGLDFIAALDPDSDSGGRGQAIRIPDAVRHIESSIRDVRPAVVVSDLYSLAPALAAERAEVGVASLFPHPYYVGQRGYPVLAQGLLPPRTPLGKAMWRGIWPLAEYVRSRKRAEHNELRAEVGLAPVERKDAAISAGLAMVATFPQLEFPRHWPPAVHVIGPMLDETPRQAPREAARPPLVVVVSTSTELGSRTDFVALALDALADEPVSVVASLSRRGESWRGSTPHNARVVDWLSFAEAMPGSSLVVCQGGHGSVAAALACGVPVLACPTGGDMPLIGARLTWAGAGMMIPKRIFGAAPVRRATRRLLADPRFAARAAEIAAWSRANPGPVRGAALVERYALR